MTMPGTWAIQTNFIAEDQIRRVWTAAEDAGARVQEIKVIEFNTFNSSGFYAHDIGKIVAAVTAHFATPEQKPEPAL
ncbi:hypothetical protein [Lysobacter sp. CA199]|uniref:hypothetical protein n=1 Tax=Lysobacter sp. CA199 TaxID=3455608 RepID=UPI003F8D0B4E